ncbi:B- and T-lymphocyte attenuator [Manis pentadactyla]|uniref:B- and T-lymphocyte attenuator n=1 Tax=Manis pentadactyla TaxID=143292 RepID=UPI001873B3E4|nr:B- and T-lymphocyte attenuator [Manis pentadactyla]KAI5134936.1 B- And T-Lymphocyte Attenuator [Manis pentadactyla]
MKTMPAILGIRKLFWGFVLIPHLAIWSIKGEKPCNEQLYVRRYSKYSVSVGEPFELRCPVIYCTYRPNVTWCKFEGKSCLSPGDRLQGHTHWEEEKNTSTFILHFNQVLASDNGSYRCSANFSSGLMESHSITISVTERIQNNSEHPVINTTRATEAPSKEEMVDRRWILYSLLPLSALPLLSTCVCLFCCLRRHQAEQKKPSDSAGREINLVDFPQPFRHEQSEVGIMQNSQTLPSETGIYDNDPWFRVQEESGVYSNLLLEENKQGIVYASLNHSIIEMNPRQARNVKEAPTEYAAICVRS